MIVNGNMYLFVIMLLPLIYGTTSEYVPSCRNFDCEYKLLSKLIHLEERTAQQDNKISLLTAKLEDAEKTIANLNNTIATNHQSADGTTYIRWGRTTCPGKAVLVYDGYVAGSSHLHTGTAVNPLCLPKNPDYEKHLDGFQKSGMIFGAEYQTNSYPYWAYLHDHEIPCAVCRVPRNDVLMVPGKNRCHDNYILEYKGYLMAERHIHASSSEFVCVDGNPEIIKGTHQNLNGKLFYFVEGSCGSLPCNPYKNGWELTCAVCSYSHNAKLTSIQQYT